MTPTVTVVMLAYKSPAWMRFALEGLANARNATPYRVMVVGNDASDEVRNTGRLDVDFRNKNPDEYYINRVYRAWNYGVKMADTDLVVLINSDMYVSNFWLDELVKACQMHERIIPCSLLVESGRIDSAMPEHVRDFGYSPLGFDRDGWSKHALNVRQPYRYEPGRLFMPALFERRDFLRWGGYPEGNVDGVSGDRFMFDRCIERGYKHYTCLGSVVYHVQEGEMRC